MPMTFRAVEVLRLNKSCKLFSIKKQIIASPALVSKAKSITQAIKLIDGLKFIRKGSSVLIKVNNNSDDAYPGTSRPEGLRELIRLLKKKGARVTVGDMSSVFWSHTKDCARTVGLLKVCEEEKVPMVFFENSEWVSVPLKNSSLKCIWLTSELCNHDFLINLAVLKTHRMADFTLSLKNLMGCLHLRTRLKMHSLNLKGRIGEFNKAITPVLNIVDGTKCFIDGGPDKGVLREPGIVFASTDRVALDVTCVRELQKLGSKSLKGLNPWTHPQIKNAVNHELGVSSDEDIKVITGKP